MIFQTKTQAKMFLLNRLPVPLDEEAGDEGAQNVSDGGVGIPDPEDESLLAAAEPVRHHRHDAGPASGLKHAAGDLGRDSIDQLKFQ